MPETIPQEESSGPRVSAILVAYNQAEALRRSIQALEQSAGRERLEILVVDCGSQDESARMDSEFRGINMLRLPHHLGAARAMNIAVRTAKAELLFFVSPDVEVEPATVTALADRLEAASGAAAVCPLLVDEGGRPASRIAKLPTKESLAAACHGQAPAPAPLDLAQERIAVEYPSLDALLVRKVFLRGMNYFDQRFGHHWADADLAMQARRAAKTIHLFPGIRARLHSAPDPLAEDSLARADLISGAAAFLGKYDGAMAGWAFRLKAAFQALARFDLAQFTAVLAGRKLDGSQAA